MFQQALCSALELIINKALTLNSKEISLGSLELKTFTVLLDELDFPLSFYCSYASKSLVDDTKLVVKIIVLSSIEQSDCLIKTSLSTLKELKETQQLTQLIKQDKLEIEGDIKVAQQFMQFAQSLHIDWLTELANHIGEVPTYKLCALAKKSLSQLNFTKTQIQADASEYIVHEQRLVVTNSELKRLYMQVSEVEKSIAQLERRMLTILENLAVK